MALAHESVVFDVHDCKVYPLTADTGASASYGAGIDVPGIAEISCDPNLITAELKGDARIIAKKGRVDKFTGTATYGKISLDVLNVILEGEITDTASTSAKFSMAGDNALPYFKLAFKIEDLSLGLGDLHVVLFKTQITGGTLLSGKTDEFGQPTFDFEGIPLESTDELIDVEFLSTVTAL